MLPSGSGSSMGPCSRSQRWRPTRAAPVPCDPNDACRPLDSYLVLLGRPCRRDLLPPEHRRVHRKDEWMRSGCHRAALLRDPAHPGHGSLHPCQDRWGSKIDTVLSHVRGVGDSASATRGPTGNTAAKSFSPSKSGDGLRAFAIEASATTQLPTSETLHAVHERETSASWRSFFDRTTEFLLG